MQHPGWKWHKIFIILRVMGKWLQKILFVAISISFFISATEIDIGEAHNAFFDEYDIYVKTEHVSVDHANPSQQTHQPIPIIYYILSFHKGLHKQSQSKSCLEVTYHNHYPPKLF